MKIKTLIKLVINPRLLIKPMGRKGLLSFLSDSLYLKLLFRAEMGKKLDLKNPITFNEKIQWLKLNDKKIEYIKWVDKIEVKKQIEKTIGPQYVVPLIATWNNAEKIDFSQLPPKCVLKCNHDQGSTQIYVRGKTDEWKMKKHLSLCLSKSVYPETREWPYKNISPMILCEPYLADNIIDYKLFCFNGTPKVVNIGMKSQENHETQITFLDMDWNVLKVQRSDFRRVDVLPPKPDCFDEICYLSRILAKDKRFVRIDFFIVDNKPFFSEFTLYPTSGLIKFSPTKGDDVFGKWLDL